MNFDELQLSKELYRNTLARVQNPELGYFFDEYSKRGLLRNSAEIINGMKPELREPVVHTMGTHITKEKPLFVYSLARAARLPLGKSRVIASSVDLLWSLSLMYDDIFDGDEKRAGILSSWVKYGVERTKNSVWDGLRAIWSHISETFDSETANLGKRDVEDSISSLSKHKELSFNSPLEEVYDNYFARQSFHCKFPVSAIWKNKDSDSRLAALNSLNNVNLAGQITNDIKDMLPSYGWMRDGFSDLRSGLTTIPLWLMFDGISLVARRQVESLVGSKELNQEEQAFLRECLVDSNAVSASVGVIRLLYERVVEDFAHAGVDTDGMQIMERWIKYKEKQIEGFYVN